MLSKPYHPANVAAQPFPAWRVIALAWVGKALGIQFKIDGIPYGAEYRPELWADPRLGEGGIGIGYKIGDGLNDAF